MTALITTSAFRRFLSQLISPSHPPVHRDESAADDERYLSQAVDMGDLERRMRQLERGVVESAHTQLSMMSWGH